jgi:hypothetical protein
MRLSDAPKFLIGFLYQIHTLCDPNVPLTVCEFQGLGFQSLTFKILLPTNNLDGIELPCEINPQNTNSSWIYHN